MIRKFPRRFRDASQQYSQSVKQSAFGRWERVIVAVVLAASVALVADAVMRAVRACRIGANPCLVNAKHLVLWSPSQLSANDLELQTLQAAAERSAGGHADARLLETFAVRNPRLVQELQQVRATPSSRKRAMLLAELMHRGHGGYACGTENSIAEKLSAMQRSQRCCSDYTQVFVALANLVNVASTEVMYSRHQVVSIIDDATGLPLFFDPSFGLWARDEQGSLVSAARFREMALRGNVAELTSSLATLPRRGRWIQEGIEQWYQAPSDFASFSLIDARKVSEVDELESRLSFLPKTAAQVIGVLSGVRESRMVVFDAAYGNRAWEELAARRSVAIGMVEFATSLVLLVGILTWSRHLERRSVANTYPIGDVAVAHTDREARS
jgi:hypothetical protein